QRAAKCDSQAHPFHAVHCQSLLLILLGRWPARRDQLEASSFYILVNVYDVGFTQESRPRGHALLLTSGHRDREKLLLLHGRDRPPQIGSQLTSRRVGSMAAITIRVIKLITMEDVLGDLGSLAIDEQREVQLDAGAVLKRMGVSLHRLSGCGGRLQEDPLRDLGPLRFRQVGM